MGSRAVLLLIGPSPPKQKILFLFLLNYKKVSSAPSTRRFTAKATVDGSSLEPPDVARLAETARISLTPEQRGEGGEGEGEGEGGTGEGEEGGERQMEMEI
ncbi:hypothetical protein OIU85_017812 [Salix viminalis]|uniref:Uncharacterized protein n=1 Tax=Salix viminalis TaxID=40686 RepID=A0A9Q0S9I2_SALVM|nr:hypothetical protein OIU85_017812 [Salix viminalis]